MVISDVNDEKRLGMSRDPQKPMFECGGMGNGWEHHTQQMGTSTGIFVLVGGVRLESMGVC